MNIPGGPFVQILVVFGAIAILSIIGVLFVATWGLLSDFIDHLKYVYRQKHRFDKPPLAKCFCRDCDNWDPKTNKCWSLDRYMAANWFCYDANPLRHERDICKNECKFGDNINE